MYYYSHKLLFLLARCLLLGLIGGTLFTVISGQNLGLIPYVAAMGAGAGWRFTRPLGVAVLGRNGLILSATLLAVRLGLALVIGWAMMIPYMVYLSVRMIRG